jgi:hypothetical protein
MGSRMTEDGPVTVDEYRRVVKNCSLLEAEIARMRNERDATERELALARKSVTDQWAWFVALLKEFSNGD